MPINIVDEGAIPTYLDSTFDSTKAIQRAINRAQVTYGSKEIEIPEGEFNVFGKLNNYDNLTFVGGSTPKHYWRGSFGDVFSKGGSVLKGNGTQELFDAPGESWHVSVKNVSFTGFTRLVVPNDPRSFEFDECSFKDMMVLNAPSSSSDMYQNFRFRGCSFTVYGPAAVFSGRLIDCEWIDNVFLGSAGLELNGARADRIFNNRFEWIDRAFAVSMYGCDNVQIKDNWFDRVAGVGVQIKQGNKDTSINDNIFSRCGGLLKADGSILTGIDESYAAYVQIWGDQENGLQINDNQFIKGAISDGAGASIAPKYVLAFRPVGSMRSFQFKGNSIDASNAYTERLIYDGGVSWMAGNAKIETDAAFDYLDNGVVDLSIFSKGKIVAQNIEAVTVREIPEKLIVNNSFDASITIEAGGKQTGVVFGGKVNGVRRFGKNEQLLESLVKQTIDGTVTGNKISYTINNITKALRGAPVYLTANYSTLGSPETVVEVADATGAIIATLTPLVLSEGVNKMYAVKFIVPEDYALTSIKVYFYTSKSVVKTTGDKITIDGFCATYGDWITRGIIDVNNV